jgi:hypothetical protein
MRERRIRVSIGEVEAMEGGVRCPLCNRYACFGDVVATGRCGGCSAQWGLDLVVYESG